MEDAASQWLDSNLLRGGALEPDTSPFDAAAAHNVAGFGPLVDPTAAAAAAAAAAVAAAPNDAPGDELQSARGLVDLCMVRCTVFITLVWASPRDAFCFNRAPVYSPIFFLRYPPLPSLIGARQVAPARRSRRDPGGDCRGAYLPRLAP